MAVAMVCIGGLGLVIQQALLRWNQGQDLRQALITIALSVIIADQVIAHFPRSGAFQTGGGNLATITWPGWTERRIDLQVAGVEYSLTRLLASWRSASPSALPSGPGSIARGPGWSSGPGSTTGR